MAIALLTLVIGWSANTILSQTVGDSDDSASTTKPNDGSSGARPEPSPSPSPPDIERFVDRCEDDVAKAEEAVAAARPGVAHWTAHVKARRDMLAGRISARRMGQIYEDTRRRGPADHERFQAALAAFDGSVPCEDLRSVHAQVHEGIARRCLVRSEAAAGALTAARGAMRDWRSHLNHMDRYADGGMTGGKALRLWIQAWRAAPENISAYREGLGALRGAPSCSTDR